MSRVALQQIIRRQTGASALLSALAEALGTPFAVEDPQGRLVHGQRRDGESESRVMPRSEVTLDETSLGWVSGTTSTANAAAVAAVLAHLAAREAEHKALGAEVLHLYREINLIYSFSEKLAALLDVALVAELTLQEAQRLIAATDSALVLLDETSDPLTAIAGKGQRLAGLAFRRDDGLLGAVTASGAGEIVNDVETDARLEAMSLRALIYAPLKTGERVIGLIALGSTMPATYTAAELKLLNTLALQAATAIENARLFERTVQAAREHTRLLALHQAAELARTRLDSELTLASRIQADLFPARLPAIPSYDLAARNRPARRCGGDYYDVLRTESDTGAARILCCVADVAGKGLPAALVMSNMQATLRALLGRLRPLASLAGHASDLLYAATPPEKYVTAALAELSPETGALTFVSAGHLDNVIVRANGEIVPLTSTGLPLGLLPDGAPYSESAHHLHSGDTLVLYSDGVTDAQNPDGLEFGDARLHDLLRALTHVTAETMADAILHAVDLFVESTPQFDDMTLLIVRRD